jgi:hypothetical protein
MFYRRSRRQRRPDPNPPSLGSFLLRQGYGRTGREDGQKATYHETPWDVLKGGFHAMASRVGTVGRFQNLMIEPDPYQEERGILTTDYADYTDGTERSPEA